MLRCCCLCALSAAVMSAELSLADIRVDIEVLPNEMQLEALAESGGSAAVRFDTALGVAAGGQYAFTAPGRRYGLSLGAALAVANYDVSHVSYATYGIRAGLGAAYSLNDRWTLTLEPLIEYGLGELNVSKEGIGSITADGSYLWLGGDIRATFAITDQWQLDAHIGYLSGDNNLTSNANADVGMEHDGPFGGIGITYRIAAAPPVLE